MTIFPALASTLSENELGEFAKKQYRLSEDFSCKLFRTGINHTYILSNKKTKYVLRVYCYNWRSETEITEEIKLLNLLKAQNISISYPITDQNGMYIQALNAPEGLRYAVLFSFGEGGKVRFINEQICFTIGATMAKIHTVTSGKKMERIVYNDDSLLQSSYTYIKSFFAETLDEMKYIRGISAKIAKTFATTNLPEQHNGLVHLDIWYDNMSIKNENDLTIFDFDNCGNGWLILDVAYFCKQLFHIETDKNVYEQKVCSFLQGYQKHRPLSDEELRLIPDFGAAIFIYYLGMQAKRFDWSNIFLSENYLKMYVGKIKSWMEYHQS